VSTTAHALAWPRPVAAWWERSTSRERALVVVAVIVVGAALLYTMLWQPLTREVERLRAELPREREMLTIARGQVTELSKASTSTAPLPTDLRGPVERVLDEQGLRGQLSALEARDGNIHIVLSAVDFNALIRFLGALEAQHGTRAVEATLTARVEPGTVRADLTLGR
jgi:general secretion pathway protein M